MNVAVASEDDGSIIDAPMPEGSRTRVRVFRDRLFDLRDDCRAIKRRGRSIPFLFTLGWSALTAAGYSAVGLFVASNENPKPSHNVFLMYQIGLLAGVLAGVILLLWGFHTRKSFKEDLDDLAKKIEAIDYTSEPDRQ